MYIYGSQAMSKVRWFRAPQAKLSGSMRQALHDLQLHRDPLFRAPLIISLYVLI